MVWEGTIAYQKAFWSLWLQIPKGLVGSQTGPTPPYFYQFQTHLTHESSEIDMPKTTCSKKTQKLTRVIPNDRVALI